MFLLKMHLNSSFSSGFHWILFGYLGAEGFGVRKFMTVIATLETEISTCHASGGSKVCRHKFKLKTVQEYQPEF